MSSPGFRIGQIAERSGVSVDTLRYYERRRLLPRAARTDGGFRLFTPETVGRVRFIKVAQELGLSLDEVKSLLSAGGARECEQVRDVLRAKLDELDERMRRMREFRHTLAHHLAACEKELEERGVKAQCPVLVNISHPQTGKGVKR